MSGKSNESALGAVRIVGAEFTCPLARSWQTARAYLPMYTVCFPRGSRGALPWNLQWQERHPLQGV